MISSKQNKKNKHQTKPESYKLFHFGRKAYIGCMFDEILFIYINKSQFAQHNVYQSQQTVALLTAEEFGDVGRRGLVTTEPKCGR